MPARKTRQQILLVTRPLVPPWDEASKNFAYFLAKSIDEADMALHVMTARGRPLQGLPRSAVEHPVYPVKDDNHAGFPLAQKIRLPWFLLSEGGTFDVLHYLFTPTRQNSFFLQPLVRRHQKTVQTIATLREDLFGPADWKRMFFADRLVTYSDYSKRRLETEGFTGVTRIYPGVDLLLYRPRPKDSALMELFRLRPEHFVVTWPGEYVRLGATDMLVETLIRYFRERSDSPMVFLFACRLKDEADRTKKQEVEARLREAGLLERVRFTDTCKDMPGLYSVSDLVLFPVSDMRGKFDVPLIIIEAYAAGKPVILSDLPLFREFADPAFSVIIPKSDGNSLIQAIEDLRQTPERRAELGRNARGFAERAFDLLTTAQEYAKLYRSL